MKTLKSISIPTLIIFATVSIAAFIIFPEKTEIFWISYAAVASSLGLSFFGGYKIAQDSDTPSSFMFSTLSGIHLAAVILAILVFGVKFHIAAHIYAAIHIMIFGAFIALTTLSSAGHRYIQAQEEALRNHKSYNRIG